MGEAGKHRGISGRAILGALLGALLGNCTPPTPAAWRARDPDAAGLWRHGT